LQPEAELLNVISGKAPRCANRLHKMPLGPEPCSQLTAPLTLGCCIYCCDPSDLGSVLSVQVQNLSYAHRIS